MAEMQEWQLASALEMALRLETQARDTWNETEDLPDKDAALVMMRHAKSLRLAIESWIGKRALRAHLEARRA